MKRVVIVLILTLCTGTFANELDFNKLLFVKHHTYTANHYYTEYLNSKWLPGGNLCVLDMKTQDVVELVPELKGGVFGRFDLDFDACHIVFAWKKAQNVGYRLYEIEINPVSGQRVGTLNQLTFPLPNEAELVAKYEGGGYHHGTDDMHPCYLPDGAIVFISTRCQTGVLCNGADIFTVTTLFRMDRDGSNIKQLSFGALNESSPTILPDGRIMYTRWEYVDKGAVVVKCLWAMRADGSGSAEIYGNDIAYPPTMIFGRPIPGSSHEYVINGTPHCPQNPIGTVIRLDMTKNIRTTDPMTYMTPSVDVQKQGGFHFKINGKWIWDKSGQSGRLFREPYPLSRDQFLVSYKESGVEWLDPNGYNLGLLEEGGQVTPIYEDSNNSCFTPFPLRTRQRPPVLMPEHDSKLATKGLATCVVTDVYHGLEGIERGQVKYIRVLEQIARPWTARRFWDGDGYDQQHAVITKDTHLGLKVQHGVVPVEADGSAHFLVPANRNMFFQVLDENYMALQTERTFVNYMPGETRACIGCHETPNEAATAHATMTVKALQRPASIPGPQLGETCGQRSLDYATDVQPVLDAHCIKCHADNNPKGGLTLTGTMTTQFSMSYESLIESRRDPNVERAKRLKNKVEGLSKLPVYGIPVGDLLLIGPTIGENHKKVGNSHYLPAKSLGSHTSVLVAMLAPDKVKLADPADAAWAVKLATKHTMVKMSDEELLKITNWIDTNAQFYGMYWGRRGLEHRDHPNFRPISTFERAISTESTIPEAKR